MSWWMRRPTLEPGEVVRWRGWAHRDQGRRLVGGVLYVTDRRILFLAHRLDVATLARHATVALADVERVEVCDPQRSPPPRRKARPRLLIHTALGSQPESLVVRGPGLVLEHIGDAIAARS